ncbi:MAG: hypothetical protein ABIF17_04680 [Patescibacteria group bacterium]
MLSEKLNKKVKTSKEKLLSILANLILAFHAIWAVLIIVSIPLVVLVSWFKGVALAIIATNIAAWKIFKRCPLNIWEYKIRKRYNSAKADLVGFPSSQIKRYLKIDVHPSLVKYFMYSYIVILLILVLVY